MDRSASHGIVTFGDQQQGPRRQQFLELLRASPIPDDELLINLGLYLTPQTLSRILFIDHLYRQILDVQGIVIEFGCRWGQNASLFSALRGIYEPFNRLRKVVACDTFEGFISVTAADGDQMNPGGYGVSEGYANHLAQILKLQEQESPQAHLNKHEILEGDAVVTLARYLEQNPQTIIALAYFDMDLYQPTRDCLQAIKGHLTQGSVIGFDELNDPSTPGETLALKEVFGLGKYAVRRYPHCARTSYLVVDQPPDR